MHNVSLEQTKDFDKEELPNLILPHNWWSRNYSYDYYPKENNSEIQLFKFEPKLKDEIEFEEIRNSETLKSINGWDYSLGDYYVSEKNYKNKANNQKFNTLFANNFLYIGIAFAIVITLLVLNIVVSI
jgi:ribosomal protein L33